MCVCVPWPKERDEGLIKPFSPSYVHIVITETNRSAGEGGVATSIELVAAWGSHLKPTA